MKLSQSLRLCATLTPLIFFTGCASIVSGPRKNVQIDSVPSGAHVSIADKRGREVASLTTPCVASLKRGDGPFVPASYTAKFDKPGYKPEQVQIKAVPNPWYLGNVLIGGLIGLVIVDPISGAMYTLTPSEIHANLSPAKR